MVVYIVFFDSGYDVHEIDEIFLNENKANAYAEKKGKHYHVGEFDVIE